jgi:hypothetical protein
MKHLLILSILLLPIAAFSQKTYEYLSLSQNHKKFTMTKGTEIYEEIELKDVKTGDRWDFRPLFRSVEQYESEGWVVFSTNQHSVVSGGDLPAMHFLLRREKSE